MRTSTVCGMAIGFFFALAACSSDTSTSGSTSNTGEGGSAGETGSGTTASSGTGTSGSGGSAAQALKITVYSSDPSGPAVNSILITGAKEAILVDGQFFKTDAENVIKFVKDSGKTLKMVLLTHAHPDHYLGLDPIQTAFSGVPVVATKDVITDFNKVAAGTLAYLKTTPFGPQIADKLATLTELSGSEIDLEGQALKVIELPNPGESERAAALGLTNPNALIAGDALYNNVHLYLAECKSQGWLDNLTALKAKGFAAIYPGHGAETTMAALDADAEYIKDVIPIMNAAATADDAKAQIKQKYATFQSDFLLGLSVDTYFKNCKPMP